MSVVAALLAALTLAASTDTFAVRLISQTQTTVTLGWDRQPGDGYRFWRDGQVVSRTFDPSRTSVRFAKGASYRVEVLHMTGGATGDYPPTTDATVRLDPAGSDTNPCTSAAPCRTLQRGLAAARFGDTVLAAVGTYPGGILSGDKRPLGVVLQGAGPGSTITSRLTLAGLHGVTVRGFALETADPYRDLLFDACNSDLLVQQVTGRKFTMLEGNERVRLDQTSWGGYGTPGDTIDNAIGTAGAAGPIRSCDGTVAGPATNVAITRSRFHHVFWGVPASAWAGAHPDCLEVNGNVDGLLIEGNEFDHCADSFFGLYTDQGDLLDVTFVDNNLHDGGTDSYYAIQNVCSGQNGYLGGGIVFRGNTFNTNPAALDPYPALREECRTKPGFAPPLVEGNQFRQGPPPGECAISKGTFGAVWRGNSFELGDPCVS